MSTVYVNNDLRDDPRFQALDRSERLFLLLFMIGRNKRLPNEYLYLRPLGYQLINEGWVRYVLPEGEELGPKSGLAGIADLVEP